MESNTWTASSQLALEITAPKPWRWRWLHIFKASTASTNPWQDSSSNQPFPPLAAQMALSRSVKICQDPSRQGANDICLNGLCLHGEQKLQSILPLLTSRVDQWLPKGGSPILCLYEYGLIWDDLGGGYWRYLHFRKPPNCLSMM